MIFPGVDYSFAYMKYSNFTIVVLLGIILSTGCKKHDSDATPKPAILYNISFTGNQVASDTIYYTRTPLSGKKFLWNFGDGTFSTDSAPFHIYGDSGTFNISLVVDADTAIARTIIKIYPEILNKTFEMASSRVWHHYTYYKYSPTMLNDTTVYYPDFSSSVIYVDPTTVVFSQDTLVYFKSDDSSISFRKPLSKILYFNFLANGIQYTYIDEGVSHYIVDFYYTP